VDYETSDEMHSLFQNSIAIDIHDNRHHNGRLSRNCTIDTRISTGKLSAAIGVVSCHVDGTGETQFWT
jgi:hypothetical protein